MAIQYIRIEDKLRELNLNPPCFCMDAENRKDCSITRVQIDAEFRYDSKRGPYIDNEVHDEKCRCIFEMEKNKPSDLLLFPEYCISYNLLDIIVTQKELWPQENKLWCLPCQGISHDEFFSKMGKYEQQGIVIIKDAYTKNLSAINFINALFYCFIATSETGDCRIVLVPQIKTCPMRDTSYACEEYMSLGSTIFVFGSQNGVGLISLLCADSLNNYIKLGRSA